MDKDNDDEVKKVEKVLGEPVLIGFDDKTTKIRTFLFLFSVVSIGYALGGLKIDATSSFLGLKFTGLNDELFRTGLLVTVGYLLIHFIWNSFDTFLEWRLRISGTRVAFTTGSFFGNKDCDYPKEPRQSTLYNWWRGQANLLDIVNTRFRASEKIVDHAKQYDQECQPSLDPAVKQNLIIFEKTLKHVTADVDNFKSMLEELKKLYDSKRIDVSLKRFDNWFNLFLQSQNLRWIVIEFSLPAGLGLAATCLLWP